MKIIILALAFLTSSQTLAATKTCAAISDSNKTMTVEANANDAVVSLSGVQVKYLFLSDLYNTQDELVAKKYYNPVHRPNYQNLVIDVALFNEGTTGRVATKQLSIHGYIVENYNCQDLN